MDNLKINDFYFSCFRKCFGYFQRIYNPIQKNSNPIKLISTEKGDNNNHFTFDIKMDEIIKSELEKYEMTGRIFSEESKFFDNGKLSFRVVYDPVCNSSLLAKGVMDAACGITIFSNEYKFIASGILDYQTGIIAIATKDKTSFYQFPFEKEINPFDIFVKDEKNWVVIKFDKKEERQSVGSFVKLLQFPDKFGIESGHIYWLRLAAGIVSGYGNIVRGEKLYEMFAAATAQKAGCIVTDLEGNELNVEELFKEFEKNPNQRYKFIAAKNKELHQKLMSLL